jgi:hypothetical protein
MAENDHSYGDTFDDLEPLDPTVDQRLDPNEFSASNQPQRELVPDESDLLPNDLPPMPPTPQRVIPVTHPDFERLSAQTFANAAQISAQTVIQAAARATAARQPEPVGPAPEVPRTKKTRPNKKKSQAAADPESQLHVLNETDTQEKKAYEDSLLGWVERPAPKAKKGKKAKDPKEKQPSRLHYIALDPAQQGMVQFLSKPGHDPVTRASWLAQLCIPPIGIDDEPQPAPFNTRAVEIAQIQSRVINWAKSNNLQPLVIRVGSVYLKFKRCVAAPVIELSKPFETLQKVLQGEDLLYQAQNEFAEYGLVMHLSKK